MSEPTDSPASRTKVPNGPASTEVEQVFGLYIPMRYSPRMNAHKRVCEVAYRCDAGIQGRVLAELCFQRNRATHDEPWLGVSARMGIHDGENAGDVGALSHRVNFVPEALSPVEIPGA
ncbi:MAG: hypothetical protein WDO68_30270 [Gammaproteobacteria bacterium]